MKSRELLRVNDVSQESVMNFLFAHFLLKRCLMADLGLCSDSVIWLHLRLAVRRELGTQINKLCAQTKSK